MVATIGNAFGMSVVGWSRNLTHSRAKQFGVNLVTKETLLAISDIVSIHLVLSELSKGLIGDPELSLMKPTAFLVNTSRGPIIEESALIKALRANKIAGAGLDVFDQEPLPINHPFLELDNTVITPHLGYVTNET